MLKTVLFDLDGTLLPIDPDEFLRLYLGRLSRYMAPHLAPQMAPEQFIPRLMEATRVMVANTDLSRTNRDVWCEHFFQGLDLDRTEVLQKFDAFYRQEFPALAAHHKADPAAFAAVEAALEAGLDVAVATNPVFPAPAIEERMRWAGVAHLPFRLVTTFEDMHSCKPHLSYYQEVLERLGCRPEECLMVGNDVGEDVVAGKLGMKTFLVEDQLIDRATPWAAAGMATSAADAHFRGRRADLAGFFRRREWSD